MPIEVFLGQDLAVADVLTNGADEALLPQPLSCREILADPSQSLLFPGNIFRNSAEGIHKRGGVEGAERGWQHLGPSCSRGGPRHLENALNRDASPVASYAAEFTWVVSEGRTFTPRPTSSALSSGTRKVFVSWGE